MGVRPFPGRICTMPGAPVTVLAETYRGRRIRARPTSDRWQGRRHEGLVNGEPTGDRDPDPHKVLACLRAWIDFIDRDPVVDGGRWPAHWYAPGTYHLCPDGHPVAPDGACRHTWCTTTPQQ
jgi:hypothetical protein